MRNATIRLLSNDFNQFIIDLSRNAGFMFCTAIISEPARKRRFDQELVLRFFAFKNDFTSYRHDVADFLTDYMESVSDPGIAVQFDYEEERETFDKTFRVLRLIAENLGIDSRIFGTVVGPSADPRGQFSVYHYEGLVLGLQAVLAQVDESNVDHVAALASVVSTGKADQAFLTHTGAGKNQRGSLYERMNYFARRFEAALA